jgi:hypothetical protein
MTDYVLRHINRTRIVDIFRRKLRIWSTIIKEDIDNRVDILELIADNARFHGQALGYFTAISEYLAERETDVLEAELMVALDDNKRRVDHYINYGKYMLK